MFPVTAEVTQTPLEERTEKLTLESGNCLTSQCHGNWSQSLSLFSQGDTPCTRLHPNPEFPTKKLDSVILYRVSVRGGAWVKSGEKKSKAMSPEQKYTSKMYF